MGLNRRVSRAVRSQRGGAGRRRALVVSAAVGALGLAFLAAGIAQIVPALGAGAPSRPVDRTLDRYVLFAFDTLSFKGGEHGRGFIRGGDVGANGIDTKPSDNVPVLNLCSNHHTFMDAGSQVVAASMRLTSNCQVWDIYTNQLMGSPPVAGQNSGPNAFTAPILAAPAFPAFSCNAANPVNIAKNATATLAPGTYGNVFIGNGAKVTLQVGVYTMCDFQTGKNSLVTTVAGVELRITKTFGIGDHGSFGPACDVPVYVRADGKSANQTAVAFSNRTDIHGRFLSLKGEINLGDSDDLFGSFFGNRIVSDQNVNVTGCGGGGTTTTTGAPTTASTSTTTTTSTTIPSTTSTTAVTTSTTSTTSTTGTTSTTSAPTSTTIPETTTSTSTPEETTATTIGEN